VRVRFAGFHKGPGLDGSSLLGKRVRLANQRGIRARGDGVTSADSGDRVTPQGGRGNPLTKCGEISADGYLESRPFVFERVDMTQDAAPSWAKCARTPCVCAHASIDATYSGNHLAERGTQPVP
jgi:hypothetical protein